MRIKCPYCGVRDHSEFTYGGDATLKRPEGRFEDGNADDNSADNAQAWKEYVYERENPAVGHKELWHHTSGCRCWITVQRNIRTHEIDSVQLVEAKHGEVNHG